MEFSIPIGPTKILRDLQRSIEKSYKKSTQSLSDATLRDLKFVTKARSSFLIAVVLTFIFEFDVRLLGYANIRGIRVSEGALYHRIILLLTFSDSCLERAETMPAAPRNFLPFQRRTDHTISNIMQIQRTAKFHPHEYMPVAREITSAGFEMLR
ncbi:MAG: hypothetical protein WCA38_18655 [Candidatus Acidiferrales bacterium]